MSTIADSPEDRLTREEALDLMGRLLQGVPEERLPLVAAQAVWGMGPWSSRTAVVRVMAEWVVERFGDGLPPLPRALVIAACARADIADRRFIEAIENGEAATEEAGRCGDERVSHACRALLARAFLQNGEVGRGLQVLGDLADADLPPALRPEVLLALGLAEIVRGGAEQAVGRFAEAGRVAATLEGPPGSTAQWHEAMAAAGEAHVLIRLRKMAEAIKRLDRAISMARDHDALREQADLAVLRAVCRLATGTWDGGLWSETATWVLQVEEGVPGVDFLMGLPADLAGAATLLEAATRLEHAAAERLTLRDEAGFLIGALASAAFSILAGSREAALRTLDLAAEGASNLGWEDTWKSLESARRGIPDA